MTTASEYHDISLPNIPQEHVHDASEIIREADWDLSSFNEVTYTQ